MGHEIPRPPKYVPWLLCFSLRALYSWSSSASSILMSFWKTISCDGFRLLLPAFFAHVQTCSALVSSCWYAVPFIYLFMCWWMERQDARRKGTSCISTLREPIKLDSKQPWIKIFKKPRYHWLKNFFSSLLFLSGLSWLTSGMGADWDFQERICQCGGTAPISGEPARSPPRPLPGFLRAVPGLTRPFLKAFSTCGCLGPRAELNIPHWSYFCGVRGDWGQEQWGRSGEQGPAHEVRVAVSSSAGAVGGVSFFINWGNGKNHESKIRHIFQKLFLY